jgi:hypothetical protein
LREEDLETIGEGEECEDEQHGVRSVRLKLGLVRNGREEILKLHSLAEAEVGDHNDDPSDEAGDGGDVGEPSEDLRAAAVEGEIGEETDSPGDKDGAVRDSSLGGAGEELRGLV